MLVAWRVASSKNKNRALLCWKLQIWSTVVSFSCHLSWEVEIRTDVEEHQVSFDIKSVLANSQMKCIWGCVLNCSGSLGTMKTYFWRFMWFFLLWKTKGGNYTPYSFLPLLSLFLVFSLRQLLWLLSSELYGRIPVISWASSFWPC